ncbi:MAG: tetratricopeptide repeat protein, partial [Anaerolineae bacterium]|nr:tetratricopeptide repeat protein [Anaerolineae bacterium]
MILARVVASLRQDELVWKALDDETFATMAIDRLGGQANNWTPAALSLIAINQKELGAKLTTLPMQPLDANLRHLAVRTYEEVRKRGTGASGLQEACLLALALRERRRLTGSWAGMVDELLTSPAGIRALSATLWRTVVACLLGFVPNQAELFESLVGSAFGEAGLDWVSHYFLTQPDDEQLVGGRLSKLMGTIEIGKQTRLLRLIKRKGGDAVAAFAVVDYLDQSTMPGAVDEEKQLMTVEELAAEAVRMQQTAMLRSVEGNLPEALRSLDRAGKMLDIFQKGIQLQAAELGEKTVGTLGWLSVDHPVKTAKSILHEASFLVSKVEKSERVSSMPTHGAPLFEILSAEWIKDVQPGKAREQARKAANEFISATSNGYVPTEFVNQWDVVRVIHILDELGAKEEALAIGEQELCLAPANVELLSTVSDLCQKSGDLKRAKELAASAAFLAPEQLGYRRNLARLHSLMNEWPQAYRFYKEVTSESLEADVNDRIELARSAMKSNELEVAAEVCEQLLREQEDLGAAHGLLGLTRVQQGRSEDAVVHLNRATLISPEQAEWWLALANHYENASDKRAALETLRAAVLSAPQSAELHYRLGEMLLEGGMTADALPCLKRAVALIPENIDY